MCGAPNARAGMLAALALPGTTLANGLTIRRSRIRGEESEGMLCAEDELGLGEDHQGIIELAAGEPGQPASEVLGGPPAVLEIDVTANRGDCMSHLGLARELAALTGRALTRPGVAPLESGEPVEGAVEVTVERFEDCPRYVARVIRGVRVGPSPAWLVARLESVGQRSINNVVDVTNFVLRECGQPLHAFDLDGLRTGRIHVRLARPGERMRTLDGVARDLDPRVLLITDGEHPVAVAGVMGGEETEVSGDTVNILLESAVFRAGRVLRGSRALRLDTEAALRFRRGVDPGGTAWAADRAAQLIAELGGGTVAPGRIDVHDPALFAPRSILLRPERVGALLGDPVDDDEVAARLRAFGLDVERVESGTAEPVRFRVAVPTWRSDLVGECDLIEEVARHRGYDAIGTRLYNAGAVNAPVQESEERRRRVAGVMRGLGFSEILTRNLTEASRASLAGVPPERAAALTFPVLDPPGREEEALRVSLLPALLDVVAHNLRHGKVDIRCFEVGKTFARRAAGGPPEETWWVGVAASGGEFSPSRERAPRAFDFLEFKGCLEALLGAFEIDAPGWRTYTGDAPVPAGALEATAGDESLGFAWNVTESVRSRWDLRRPVFVAQIAFDALRPRSTAPVRYREPSRFPPVKRDLALVVPVSLTQSRVREMLRAEAGAFLEAIELFDYYRGRHIPDGHVGLGYSLTFRGSDRTLEEHEVDRTVDRLVAALRGRGIARREG